MGEATGDDTDAADESDTVALIEATRDKKIITNMLASSNNTAISLLNNESER